MSRLANDIYVIRILDAIQELEEINGPESIKDYIKILSHVQQQIACRIINAVDHIEDDKE
jgi:hypothetical protein